MSMMVTGFTVGAASTDKATINGKEVSVGSKVTYKIDLKTASKIESVQGVVNFDSNVLKLDSFTMPNTTSNYLPNTNIAGEVHYAAYSVDGDFDFLHRKITSLQNLQLLRLVHLQLLITMKFLMMLTQRHY